MSIPQAGSYVLTMADIAALPWNGLNAISTFSGCGGSSLGYKMAGFKVLWANEFIPIAADTYRLNHPGTIVDQQDIRQVTAKGILDAIGLRVGELDLLDGSPPCASFSTAGKREAGWGKVKQYSETKQRTDDLFFEFIRLLEELQPKTFVAENVKGLVMGVAKGYFKQIYGSMEQAGYRVSCRVLDAQYFGVPQHRERAIFVGVRNDLDIPPSHPKPQTAPVPLRQALPWIVQAKYGADWRDAVHPSTTVSAQQAWNPWNSTQGTEICLADVDIEGYAIGREWDRIGPGGKSAKYLSLVKAHPDKPSPCVTGQSGLKSLAGVVHPYEKRKFTIPELKRICAFPDDFQLIGTYAQQWERLGRAVPPLMMKAIAEHVRDAILRKVVK